MNRRSFVAKKDLSVVIMASSIDGVDKNGMAEKQLRSAAKAGIKRYRLQHLKYDLFKPIKPQVANFKAQLADLAALNKEIGIQGLQTRLQGMAGLSHRRRRGQSTCGQTRLTKVIQRYPYLYSHRVRQWR
jgi:hypothetical protein